MKIIGKGNGSDFIVLASERELANIAGYHYQFPSGQRLDAGVEIDVSKLWQALSIERTRPDEVAKLAKSLRDVADKIDKINTALDCPIIESK